MKKITLLFLSMFILSAGLHAQKMNAVKTDLFSAFLRTGVIKYERALNENFSAQLGFFYTGYSPGDVEANLHGWGLTPEFRLYLSDTPAPVGTYLAPNFRYMSLTAEDETNNDTATLTSLGIAVNLGKQWVFKDIVVIDAWLGPAYNFRTLDDPYNETDIDGADGFGIRLGVAIGIVF